MLESYGWDNDKLLNDYIEQAKKDFSKEYFCRIQELLDDETNLDLQKRGIEYLLSIPYVHVNDYVKMSNGIMEEIWIKSIFMATLMGCCNEYEHAREADYGLVFYMEIAKEYVKEIFNSITDYLYYNLEIEHFEDDDGWKIEVSGEDISAGVFDFLYSYISYDKAIYTFGEMGEEIVVTWDSLIDGTYLPDVRIN